MFLPSELLRAKENVTENFVIMHEINKGLFQWREWHAMSGHFYKVKYFGSLIILLELNIDVSLLTFIALNGA